MNYRINPKNNDRLSLLGLGCMRFTRKGTAIDQESAERVMLSAIEQGINYFDCAYIYPGIEASVGRFLSKGYRDKVHIATKLPHYFVKKDGDPDRYFEEQLRRLRTDRIDYYLMHMLGDMGSWERIKRYGIEKWAEEKKASGQILNFGFSFHGSSESFKRLIDAYDWDFCMIQYNYIDETSQAGVSGLKYAAEKGLPVMIMEPLRGGRLTNRLPRDARALFDKARPERTYAQWGLHWLFCQQEVSVVLSGMNTAEQVLENAKTASEDCHTGLSSEEKDLYSRVCEVIRGKVKVPCTGCGYCMPCPRGVDIPVCFSCLNTRYSESWYKGMRDYFMCTTLGVDSSSASQCVKCGKCERHCPQKIDIRRNLELVVKKLETPPYKIAKRASKLIGYYKKP